MTSLPRLLTLITVGALALGMSACAAESPAPGASASTTLAPPEAAIADGACAGDEGVSILVDAGALAGGEGADRASCILTDEPLIAADALDTLGVQLEGTKEYGDQVVCRVDGMPSDTAPVGSTEDPAYVETCESMPAAFAYWSLWIKPAGGTWDYAQEGASTLQLQPGDSIELLFTLDGAPVSPDA
ncbi:hypothetical protein [Microbacterium sp.]|uniref:hypothetical protein n=1 Tax=Microbacterium sp. TaxID=51671 RepID=UPI0025EB2A9C|nr:hypothetical protein [Microbacterium sp.]